MQSPSHLPRSVELDDIQLVGQAWNPTSLENQAAPCNSPISSSMMGKGYLFFAVIALIEVYVVNA